MWLKQPFQDGEVVATEFGLGAQLGCIYTPNGLLDIGQNLKQEVKQQEAYPCVTDGLSQYAWCRWDRLSLRSASELIERCRLKSSSYWSQSDLFNYSGTELDYLNGWRKYIPTETRLKSIARSLKIKSFERKRLIDLGCAGGRHLLQLASYGIDAFGIENNPCYFSSLHPMLASRVFYGDALLDTYWFNSNSFDMAICSAHGSVNFPELGRLFSELSRILTVGGIMLLDVPPKPINIGPCLVNDYRIYLRILKECGFKPVSWSQGQIVCVAVRSGHSMASIC